MMQHSARLLAAAAALALAAAPVHAAVTISSAATQNMSCSGGICAPTARSAVLNSGDLVNLLASGNLTVTTTGSGVQAHDIRVSSALSWASSSTLSLEAHRSIAVNAAVAITGPSGLVLDTGGKKATLSFGPNGSFSFANLSSQLSINGNAYTLVGDIKTLASDIAANPSGDFALAANYNASADGTYQSCPVPTLFSGSFEGLGNIISNLSIDGGTEIDVGPIEGLFAELDAKGTMENIGLTDAKIIVPGTSGLRNEVTAGPLVGWNEGTVEGSHVSGSLTAGKRSFSGGLVGANGGTIANSYATASLNGSADAELGGLVASNGIYAIIENSHATGDVTGASADVGGLLGDNGGGTITNSYATGQVTDTGSGSAGGLIGTNDENSGIAGTIENSYATGKVSGSSYAGGLAGTNGSVIVDSYATGAVAGKRTSEVGGLVGVNGATISFSYSTGSVSGGTGSDVGGLIGFDESSAGSITDAYWDTDTSGITNLSQGAGNIANDPGITGLTTAQFQSDLPAGFDPGIWAEKSTVNGGLPYLLANPPPK
jgi:hypothetical protein